MDQAPRSAFLSLIVLPEERTAVMGVVNILKTLAQSAGPSLTGILAGHNHFWVAFVVAGSLKAAYDIMLLAFFGGRVQPRKDRSDGMSRDSNDESDNHLIQDPGESIPGVSAAEQGVSPDQVVVDSTTRS
jgi:MFS family permease